VSSTHIIEIDGFTPRQVFGAFANDPYVTFSIVTGRSMRAAGLARLG